MVKLQEENQLLHVALEKERLSLKDLQKQFFELKVRVSPFFFYFLFLICLGAGRGGDGGAQRGDEATRDSAGRKTRARGAAGDSDGKSRILGADRSLVQNQGRRCPRAGAALSVSCCSNVDLCL
jgi:hypothetical protein